MDSRASTSSLKPTPLTIDTVNHTSLVPSKAFFHSPTSPSFRPSPLNPSFTHSPTEESTCFHKRGPIFPTSRPLRPFPSIVQSLANSKPVVSNIGVHVRHDTGSSLGKLEEDDSVSGGKKSRKAIEISSKWKGGFFVLGLTQAEFSRRD